MKNRPILLLFLFSFLSITSIAQRKRCITEEKMQELFLIHPEAKIRYENTQRMINEKVKQQLNNLDGISNKINAVINIPVVVHILTSDPNQVTDAVVQSQIDTLNYYYGSQPTGDSLRVYAPFRSVYGRSKIRFCLAKRNPNNLSTTGIERVTTSTSFTSSSSHPSGTVPAWNTQKYLNIWVVQFTDQTLGYCYKPGSWAAGDQHIGFVVDYRAFGAGAPYLYTSYNLGRTAVHEIGHYFNLDHPWGPNNSGNSTCSLDDGCSDTPLTSGPTFGCPSAPVLNTCSSTAPGVMWQNHMDYADDRCMMLFTAQQCLRMESALTTAPDRNTLLSSNGCQPIIQVPNDASITSVVNPANNSVKCSSTVTPQVTLTNSGNNDLTSVNINVSLNGTSSYSSVPWTGNLSPGSSTTISLPDVTLTSGANTFEVSTSSPNGITDQNTTNDTLTTFTSLPSIASLPVIQGFENPTFPPDNWTLYNPNGDNTWVRTTPGKASSYSLFIDNFNNDAAGNIDELRTPPISTAGVTDSVIISFDIAHRDYPGQLDSITVLVSADCGNTYNMVYHKAGDKLATAGSSSDEYVDPVATDWRNEQISIGGSLISGGQIIVAFRNSNDYGNNIFIDNINIRSLYKRDIRMVSINEPKPLLCSNNINPSATIRNIGSEAITGLKVSYSIDNGPVATTTVNNLILAPNEQTTINLDAASLNTIGNHAIKVYSWEPATSSGTGDFDVSNDTLTKSFSIAGSIQAPLIENFTNTSFPPAGWTVTNPDGDITWQRYTNGNGNSGSAYVNLFNYQATSQIDDLGTPVISYSGVDSVKLTFDLAASPYFSVLDSRDWDTLEVLVTKDCGNTFTSVYKKWGLDLQTTSTTNTSPDYEFFPQSSRDWRKDTIELTEFINESPIMVLFRVTNNHNDNIFIDNVNLTTRILPAQLKQKGYIILPSPFRSSFAVWHYQQPTDLRYISVYNTAGQLVWSGQYNGNADKYITIDLSTKAAGMYIVKLGYANGKQSATEKIIKY